MFGAPLSHLGLEYKDLVAMSPVFVGNIGLPRAQCTFGGGVIFRATKGRQCGALVGRGRVNNPTKMFRRRRCVDVLVFATWLLTRGRHSANSNSSIETIDPRRYRDERMSREQGCTRRPSCQSTTVRLVRCLIAF